MTKSNALFLIIGVVIGLVMVVVGRSQIATAQTTTSLIGKFQMAIYPNYPQAAAWRLNTETGEMIFCVNIGDRKCIPMATSPN